MRASVFVHHLMFVFDPPTRFALNHCHASHSAQALPATPTAGVSLAVVVLVSSYYDPCFAFCSSPELILSHARQLWRRVDLRGIRVQLPGGLGHVVALQLQHGRVCQQHRVYAVCSSGLRLCMQQDPPHHRPGHLRQPWFARAFVCMYIYVYVCMYVYIYMCVHVCACGCVCACLLSCLLILSAPPSHTLTRCCRQHRPDTLLLLRAQPPQARLLAVRARGLCQGLPDGRFPRGILRPAGEHRPQQLLLLFELILV
jgi:hypothetical protein